MLEHGIALAFLPRTWGRVTSWAVSAGKGDPTPAVVVKPRFWKR